MTDASPAYFADLKAGNAVLSVDGEGSLEQWAPARCKSAVRSQGRGVRRGPRWDAREDEEGYLMAAGDGASPNQGSVTTALLRAGTGIFYGTNHPANVQSAVRRRSGREHNELKFGEPFAPSSARGGRPV